VARKGEASQQGEKGASAPGFDLCPARYHSFLLRIQSFVHLFDAQNKLRERGDS
jgi:hypothetical protein